LYPYNIQLKKSEFSPPWGRCREATEGFYKQSRITLVGPTNRKTPFNCPQGGKNTWIIV